MKTDTRKTLTNWHVHVFQTQSWMHHCHSLPKRDHRERERERERKFNLSIQPALAYEDVSMLESSAKLRMAAKQ